jgi:molybdopterin-containing oxidoreductase family membrane subunit
MLVFYFERIGQSPMTWDITVIFLYFTLSAAYFTLSLREDLAAYMEHAPKRLRRLYRLLLIGYDKGEKPKVEQITWWLAMAILGLITLLSGGMIAWIFGLIPAQALWFGAFSGPYFLSAALASALAAVIVIAAIFRSVFKWQDYIKPEVFRGLGTLLGIFSLTYLYMMLQEQTAVRYAGPVAEMRISQALFLGEFAALYWPVVLGLAIPFLYLFAQTVYPKIFSLRLTVLSAAVMVVAFWVKRYLIVVPSLLFPRMPYPPGTYTPTFVEWSLVVGTFAIAVLLYMLLVKTFPMMELKEK